MASIIIKTFSDTKTVIRVTVKDRLSQETVKSLSIETDENETKATSLTLKKGDYTISAEADNCVFDMTENPVDFSGAEKPASFCESIDVPVEGSIVIGIFCAYDKDKESQTEKARLKDINARKCRKYNQRNCDYIKFCVPKGDSELIRETASRKGYDSINEYVISVLSDCVERDTGVKVM